MSPPALAMLLWWWGQQPAPTLHLAVAPIGRCAVWDTCTAAEIEAIRLQRAPSEIPNTAYTFSIEEEGYRRQLGVPDTLLPGWVMWWDDGGTP